MRPAMLPALAPLGAVEARRNPRDARPSVLRRTLAFARTVVEVFAEARELRRTLGRRYPFVDF
jgi:hypothetical protein